MDRIITEGQPVKGKITQPPKDLFGKSKVAALACLARYPKAKIVFRGQSKKEKLKWKSPKYHLSKHEIQASPPGLFAVILDSIKACAIDFDIKGPSHPEGGDPRVLKQTAQEWGLDSYPWTQASPSGGWQTIHRNPPDGMKSGTDKFGKGIDYKAGPNLLMLYDPALWTHNFNTLLPLPPQAIQAMEDIQRAKAREKLNGQQPKAGHGQTNEHLNSGFGAYKYATNPSQIGHKAFEIAQAYMESPGKTGLAEAKEKLGKSLIEGITGNKTFNKTADIKIPLEKPRKITTNPKRWHVPDWIPEIGVVLLSADKAVGKTSVMFSIMKGLTSGKHPIFKTQHPIEKALFLYCERSQDHYDLLWQAQKGDLKKLTYWRWPSPEKQKIEGIADWSTDNLRKTIQQHPEIKGFFIDRADLLVPENKKFDIRNMMMELDEIAYEHKKLFVLSRHTSKPQGHDSRNFKERTDGFKEWQHTPSVCLMLHAHDDNLLLFKQYANECPQAGLIEFEWKTQENGIVMPVYKDHDHKITPEKIEELYNPQKQSTTSHSQKDRNRATFYKVFEDHGNREMAFPPDSQDQIPVFALPRKKAIPLLESKGVSRPTADRIIGKEKLGWGRGQPAIWYCVIQDKPQNTHPQNEPPKHKKLFPAKVKGDIMDYIQNNSGQPPLDCVMHPPLVDHLLKQHNKETIELAIKQMKTSWQSGHKRSGWTH